MKDCRLYISVPLGRLLPTAAAAMALLCLHCCAYAQTPPPAAPPAKPAAGAPPATPPAANAQAAATANAVKDKITPLTEDNEVKLGRQNAEENDKHIQFVTDAAIVQRVNRIGKELADVANTVPIKPLWGYPQLKKFDYTFKIVNEKDVNAYSLPGGFIYVNKGLIDYVRSDDELAGVLAHEISHADHHHMMKLMKEQGKIQNVLLPALIGLVVATKASSSDMVNALNAGYLYTIAKTNTYGVEAEKDADHSGMLLMTHTKYNPVGLYSFMIRMAADEDRKNFVDMGILQTHPPAGERVTSARELLEELKIPIELSKVDPTLLVSINPVKPAKDVPEMVELSIRGVTLCKVVGAAPKSAADRAADIAKQLNKHIDDEFQANEVRYLKDKGKVLLRYVTVLTDADAAAQGKTLEELSKDLATAILLINQKKQQDAPHQ